MKYFKRSFNLRPSLPKLYFAWYVKIMLEYFRNLGDNNQISEKHLSQKLLILLLVLRGRHLNSAFHFTIDGMIISGATILTRTYSKTFKARLQIGCF